MSQLYLKFPFKKNYLERDFYVSSSNYEAYKLIDNYPNWPGSKINLYGPSGCGKTYLANILDKKVSLIIIKSNLIDEKILSKIDKVDCVILDDFENKNDEEFFYTLINYLSQNNKHLIINSTKPISEYNVKLPDLKSRLSSFIQIGIGLPNDDLLRIIISKTFSDKQIDLNERNFEYIIKNIDRSYEKIIKFINDVDNESLSSGKTINIKLIKKILLNE
tara:strand:+ start:156 stop:812 length:657 start_codon:yes stop_codon:yes gene_type:complete